MTHMLQEIHEQPEVLARLYENERQNIEALRDAMKARGVDAINIVARGTSGNAATFGKYLLEIVGSIPVSHAAPSVFTLYDAKLDLSRWLVLGISQSGESTDVLEVLKRARKAGALTASITNTSGSSLAESVDFPLVCNAGEEKSVAATKTYTATLGILYLLTSVISDKPDMVDDIRSASNAVKAVFELEDQIQRVVERYRFMNKCIVTARGLNQATCQEAALKLAETCYIVAKPYSAADLLHGPIAAVDEGFPVFMYAPPGKAYMPMRELAEKLVKNHAELIVISTEDDILSLATTPIKIPVKVDEAYSPLVYIVVGQLFAQYLSLAKGLNPDEPRGLSKVTLTM